MGLSSSNIGNFMALSKKRTLLIFRQNENPQSNFLYFLQIKLFLSLRKRKLLKKSLIFREMETLKNIYIYFRK